MRKLRMVEYWPCTSANTPQKDKTMGIFSISFNDDWIVITISLCDLKLSGIRAMFMSSKWSETIHSNSIEKLFLYTHTLTDSLLLNLHFKSPIGYVICVYLFPLGRVLHTTPFNHQIIVFRLKQTAQTKKMINHVEAMKVTLYPDMLALISFRLCLIVYYSWFSVERMDWLIETCPLKYLF